MLRNYLTMAIRLLNRRKLYSTINALGLGIAIAFSLLVFMFIQDEQAFDRFHKDKDQVFFLKTTALDQPAFTRGEPDPYYTSPIISTSLGDVLNTEIPEVEAVTLFKESNGVLTVNDNVFEQSVHFVDTSFFDVLTFPFVSGSANKIFEQPQDAILSEATAIKYFGNTQLVGQTINLKLNGVTTSDYVIRGVVEVPTVSSLQFEILIPLNNYPYINPKSWNVRSYKAFLKLQPKAEVRDVKRKADTLIAHHRSDWFSSFRNENNIPKEMAIEELSFTPLTELHYDKDANLDIPASDKQNAWILSGIALLIIVVASINYISFALAASASRRKEIGVRKTVGASGFQIFKQFNMESLFQTAFASVIGLSFAVITLPLFNELTEKSMSFANTNLISIAAVTLMLVLILAAFSGSYPALYVARFKPTSMLRSASAVRSGFMKPLVILQFSLSAFLMVSGVIMYRQMQFIATTDLGFNEKAIIAVPINLGWNEEADRAIDQFRQAVKNEVLIEKVSGTVASFAKGSMSQTFSIDNQDITVYMNKADDHYLDLFDITLVQGRDFHYAMPADSNAIIVNQTLVNQFGWSDPLNEVLKPSGNDNNPKAWKKVIGVMKDYHFESLDQEIKPLFLAASDFHMTTLLVKLNSMDLPMALATAQKAWTNLFPDKPFDYSFVDEDIAKQYESYTRWMKITGIATTLAILIAGLGLFGLAGIQAVNKTKEIGIRKVLGADLPSLFLLINKPFVLMAMIAFALATPAAWYVMKQWLTNFKYHITVGWELFAISMLSGLLIALVSVTYHGIKTANVNPSETLKFD